MLFDFQLPHLLYMPVDMATALNAAFAISAALYRRGVTGRPAKLTPEQYIESRPEIF